MNTSDWIAIAGVALAAGGAIGGVIGWRLKRAKDARDAEPILRWDGRTLAVQNRINEDLTIERVEAAGGLLRDTGRYDDDGVWIPGELEPMGNSTAWAVQAAGSAAFPLLARSNKANVWISSSNRTLRSKRITIHTMKAE